MRKLTLLLAVVMATAVMAFAGSAFADSNGGGNSGAAPGQANATANCGDNFLKQLAKGNQAGGGPKFGEPGPTNCDHYWQTSGQIGNTP